MRPARVVLAASIVLVTLGCGREGLRTASSILSTPHPTATPSPTVSPVPTEPPVTPTPVRADRRDGRTESPSRPHDDGDDGDEAGSAPGGPGIKGVVLTDSKPVAHANVSIEKEGFHHNVTTTRRGRFAVEAPEGGYDVTVTGATGLDCESQRVVVAAEDWTKVTIDCRAAKE
jgi:hypothetical protein